MSLASASAGDGKINLVALLQACGSAQRSAAEVALEASQAADLAAFMLACAEVLRDRTIAAHIRSLAAIVLKNAIGSRGVTRSKELAARWQKLDESSKGHVRLAVLDALSDPEKDVRRAAALCIAQAGMVDIPAGKWPHAIPALTALITNTGNAPEIGSSAMLAVGLLAEEWTFYRPKESEYAEVADQLYMTTVRALQEPSQIVRVAAATALGHIMQWTICRQQRNNADEIVGLFRIVLRSCAPSEAEELRIESLKCLATCARYCYAHINAVLEELTSYVLAAMSSRVELLVLVAIDIWQIIAEKESGLEHQQRLGSIKTAYHQVIRRVQSVLVPALLEVLVLGAQNSDNDDEDSNVLHVTGECLREVGRVLGDESIAAIQAFIEKSVCSSSFHRRAALVAFGSIQPKTSHEAMRNLVEGMMPLLVEALQSGSSGLAASAAWAAGTTAEYHLAVLPLSTQEGIYMLCLNKLCLDPLLTTQVCYCLEMLIVKQTSKMPMSIFQDIMEKLFAAAIGANTDRARAALLGTLSEMCRLADDDCSEHILALLPKLLSWAKSTPGRLVEGVASCLRSLTLRLKANQVAPLAEEMLDVYFQTLQAHFTVHGCLDADILQAIGALAAVLGSQFSVVMPKLWPVLQKALKDIDEPDVCIAALAAFKDVLHALGATVQPYVSEYLEIAFHALRHREALDMRLRIDFIGCIADIASTMGASLPSLPEVLRILGEEVAQIHERESEVASEASSGKDHGNVINLLLRAYEAVLCSVDGSEQALSSLKCFLVGVLDFVCCFARSMQLYATNKSWNLGVSLVGRISMAFPQELASLVSRSVDVRNLIQELYRVSCETPDEFGGKALRPFSAPLATVLQASVTSQ